MSDHFWPLYGRQPHHHQSPAAPSPAAPPPPLAPGLATEATLHLVEVQETPGQPGALYKLFKRTDLHSMQQVGALWIGGEGMRHKLLAERVCVLLDEELKTR
jgi:hypothetical protein